MNLLSLYHRKLPETASVPFMIMYGAWAMFVLLLAVGLFVLLWQNRVDLMADFWQQKGWLLLGLPSVFAVYTLWVGDKLYRLMQNRKNIPLIRQEISLMPIPPRALPRSSFTWQSCWFARVHGDKLVMLGRACQQKRLLMGAALLLGWTVFYWNTWVVLLGLLWLVSDAPNKAWVGVAYQLDSDILTVTRQSGQNQYDLRHFVGVCAVWLPEPAQYQIQLIDKQQQAHALFNRFNTLDALAQTVSRHTGLPVLQPNLLKVTQ